MEQKSRKPIATLVISICGWLIFLFTGMPVNTAHMRIPFFSLLWWIVAIVFGIQAYVESKGSESGSKDNWMAILGLVLGALGVIMTILMFVSVAMFAHKNRLLIPTGPIG